MASHRLVTFLAFPQNREFVRRCEVSCENFSNGVARVFGLCDADNEAVVELSNEFDVITPPYLKRLYDLMFAVAFGQQAPQGIESVQSFTEMIISSAGVFQQTLESRIREHSS